MSAYYLVAIDGAQPIADLESVVCQIDGHTVTALKRGGYWFAPVGDWSVIVVTSDGSEGLDAGLYVNGRWYQCAKKINKGELCDYVFCR